MSELRTDWSGTDLQKLFAITYEHDVAIRQQGDFGSGEVNTVGYERNVPRTVHVVAQSPELALAGFLRTSSGMLAKSKGQKIGEPQALFTVDMIVTAQKNYPTSTL